MEERTAEALAVGRRRVRALERRRRARGPRQDALGLGLGPTALRELEGVAFRQGFLRAQLARGGAAGLARWFLQLKRLEAAASQEVEDEDEDEGKGALLATLRSERRVFDVLYARGERARDVRSALDQAGALEGPAEVLSFSSRASGAVCRVTCECAGRELAVTSSLFLPEALERLQELLRAGADVDAAVDAVVDALNSSQVSLLKPAP